MSLDDATGTEGELDPSFERALEGLRATGASVAIRELVELVATHGSKEGKLLAGYQALSSTTQDRAVRYLVDMVLDDERRHHRLLVELATSMAWDTLDPAQKGTPAMGWRLEPGLLDATRKLREYEEEDGHELERLRKQLKPFEDTTLWGLVVEVLELDTKKHQAILRFLERNAEAKSA